MDSNQADANSAKQLLSEISNFREGMNKILKNIDEVEADLQKARLGKMNANEVRRLTEKRNVLASKDLKPGNYSGVHENIDKYVIKNNKFAVSGDFTIK